MALHFERPTMFKHDFPAVRWTAVLVSFVLIGLMSGALGYAILGSWMPQQQLPTNIGAPVPMLRPTTSIPDVQDEVALVVGEKPRVSGTPLDGLVDPASVRGIALPMTSDGWFIVSSNVTMVGLWHRSSYYTITNQWIDPVSKIVFVKTDARPSTVVDIDTNLPRVGDIYWSLGSQFEVQRIAQVFVTDSPSFPINKTSEYIKSSDSVGAFVQLSDAANTYEDGRIFVTQNGRLMGVMTRFNNVSVAVPGMYVYDALKSLLNNSKRPLLGVSYVSLPSNNDDRAAMNRGITVYHPQQAIRPTGVASSLGIKANDVLLSINGEWITPTLPIDYLWIKNANQQIRIRGLRGETPIEFTYDPTL